MIASMPNLPQGRPESARSMAPILNHRRLLDARLCLLVHLPLLVFAEHALCVDGLLDERVWRDHWTLQSSTLSNSHAHSRRTECLSAMRECQTSACIYIVNVFVGTGCSVCPGPTGHGAMKADVDGKGGCHGLLTSDGRASNQNVDRPRLKEKHAEIVGRGMRAVRSFGS